MNLKHLYSQSLEAMGDKLHFAAHSHHLWPDCVAEGQNQYVQDAFRLADQKWGAAVSPVETSVKESLATNLHIPNPTQICFAPNVHTLFFRLISCFDLRKPLKILSSDSEFYSFSRQTLRLSEYDNISVKEVNTLPFTDFKERFLDEIKSTSYDMIYISQVFFNSGLVMNFMEEIVQTTSPDTMIIIDGYHGFGAIPVNLSQLHNSVFYLAGGYKYLQSGEGVCFMSVPATANKYRPLYTGWFAEFTNLDDHQKTVNYAPDASRFLGATTDPSGLYRMKSVFNSWKENNLSVELIHEHVLELQSYFISKIESQTILGLVKPDLIHEQEETNSIGHFLTFRTPKAQKIQQELCQLGIITDCREDRLRFGFGLYHTTDDIDLLFKRL